MFYSNNSGEDQNNEELPNAYQKAILENPRLDEIIGLHIGLLC